MGPSQRLSPNAKASPRFPVVCVLASAGGLDALAGFFRQVPKVTGAAYLVLQHHPAEQPCLLPELLQRHAAIPCRRAELGQRVEPDQALVLAPGMILAWDEGHLSLAFAPEAQDSHRPGDYLFESATLCLERHAHGVVLSGIGTDGTEGLRALQAGGGRTFAQAPATAGFDGMPRHAIGEGVVDWVLPVEDLSGKIMEELASRPLLPPEDKAPAMTRICAVLARKTDNDFSHYKPGTLQRRINHRMLATGTPSIEGYLAYLEQSAEEAQALLNDLLIGVTEFFRDPEAFEALGRQLLQELLARPEEPGPMRIWVPGCCTGEEAYSIAMVLREHLDTLGSARPIRIFATDIDTGALMHAKAGRYSPEAMRKVSPDRRARFFTSEGASFRVVKELREMCVFSIQNLVRDPPFSSLHLIACRNVFIYLQPVLQRKLIPLFHFALRPKGLLFMGSAEGLTSQPDLFDSLDKASRIFRRRDGAHRPAMDFPLADRMRADRETALTPQAGAAAPDGLFERMLLEEYVPASAIVNEQGEVLYCAGRIGRFLHPPVGAPSHNLLHSTSGPLRRELRNLLARASVDRRGAPATAILQADSGLGEETLRLTVRPMPGLERDSGVFAVIIQPLERIDPLPFPPGLPEGDNPLLDQMEAELRATRAELQATVEELGSTNEEFHASNEELQTSNEELQVSQEELHSVNEELVTINLELQQKLQELRSTNSDLQNLFVSTDTATLFLDTDLRITRFTPATKEVFRLLDGDLGRPIRDFLPLFEGADIMALAKEVLASHEPQEAQVGSIDGCRNFSARVLPYRTPGGQVSGVVVTFSDITAIMRAQAILVESQDHYRKLFQSMVNGYAHCRMKFEGDHPVDFQYLTTNSAFHTQTGLPELEGQWATDAIPGIREADPQLFERYGRVARTGCPERFELFVEALADWYDISVYCPRPDEFVAVFEVITERKRAEEEMRQSEERFAIAFNACPDAIAISRVEDGAYRMVNDGFANLLGYPKEDFIGQSAPSLHIWADPEARHRWSTELQDMGQVGWMETTLRKSDGSFALVQMTSRLITLAGEPVQLAVIRDITRRKREEEEKQLLEAEVEHMQRMESLGRLAGGVAHDMNNVLAAILAITQALRAGSMAPEALDEALATVERAATRGRDLVKGLNSFSRKGMGAPLLIDLNDLVRQEMALLDRTLLQKYRLETDLEEPLPPIMGETGLLGSALMNLCVNAVDAMPVRGTLTIRTRLVPDGQIELRVEDTGDGMAPAVLKKAMDPFFTTKPFGHGTGLGLAMVRNTVLTHGGTLSLQSEVGKGTQAVLRLPVAAKSPAAHAGVSSSTAELPPRNILLVDDDDLLRASVPILLRMLGHEVTAVDSGKAALAWLATGAHPDLVVLDMNMPDMGGLETLRGIRSRKATLPVLLATGVLDGEVDHILTQYPRVLAIGKPFTLGEIQQKLADLSALN